MPPDPLVRLPRELERLLAAQLALTEAAGSLYAPWGSDRAALRDATSEACPAARTAAAVSAQVQAVAEASPG